MRSQAEQDAYVEKSSQWRLQHLMNAEEWRRRAFASQLAGDIEEAEAQMAMAAVETDRALKI